MEEDWIEAHTSPISDDLLRAIGNLALAFAALDSGLAMVLCRGKADYAALQQAYKKSLAQKLQGIDELQRNESRPQIPTKRIRELSETRNDLLHGIAFSMIGGKKTDHLFVLNPLRDRYKLVSVSDMNKVADEIKGIVFSLGFSPAWKPN